MMERTRYAAFMVLVPEALLLLAVLASVVWVGVFFQQHEYLPQPFVFNTFDTFMDWFNTAFFAHRSSAFDQWHTVYPPLSFMFLRLVSLPGCYVSSPVYARDCDWLSTAAIFGFYVLDVVLAHRAFRRFCPERAWMRTAAFALGFPMLFLVERGNLILPCLTFFILAYGELLRSPWWRAACLAVTINFKPYLVIPVFSLVIRRDWRAFELAGIAALGLYLVSLAFYGSGTLWEILDNMRLFVLFAQGQVWEQIYFSTSFAPFLEVTHAPIPILTILPSRTLETLLWTIPLVIRMGQCAVLVCLVGAWVQPQALTPQRLAALLLVMHLSTQSPGGYTLTFLIFLLFLEPWRRPGQILAITAAYLLSVSYDSTITVLSGIPNYSWLSDRPVLTRFGLAVGQFARPGLVIVILWALVYDSLAQVVRAHVHHRPKLGLAPQAALA